MRLLKHLNEAKDIPELAWDMVQKHCKPFLKNWLKFAKSDINYMPFLYRGMMGASGEYGIKDVRKDRKPESSSYDFHIDIDNMMKQKHNINGRTKAVFASGDDTQVVTYGESYIIFPAGNYKFIWSPKIRDLYIEASKLGYERNLDSKITNQAIDMRLDPMDAKVRDELWKMFNVQNQDAIRRIVKKYTTKNLKKAIQSGKEVMIECDSYVYIQSNWDSELEDLIRES